MINLQVYFHLTNSIVNTQITAPVNGQIVSCFVQHGEKVEIGQPILLMLSDD